MTAAAPSEAFATLGDLLAGARKDSARFAAWLNAADPALAARLAAALAPGESVTARVRVALAVFAADASESDWATLISALRDSADPGLEALRRMLLKSLAAEPTG
jgi:hypothetical protein